MGMDAAAGWGSWNAANELNVIAADATASLTRQDFRSVFEREVRKAFDSGGAGTAGRTLLDVRVAKQAGPTRDESLKVGARVQREITRPRDALGWIQVLTSVSGSLYFQLNHWVIEVRQGDHYAYVFGTTDDGDPTSYEPGHESYRAMVTNTGMNDLEMTVAARAFLHSRADAPATAEGARLLVAMLVSESIRNFRTWAVNLMLLDLLATNQLTWRELFEAEKHPMCRGGTFGKSGAFGLEGGRADDGTAPQETAIFMEWLTARHILGMRVRRDFTDGAHEPGTPDGIHAGVTLDRIGNRRIAMRRLAAVLSQRIHSIELKDS